MQSKELSLKRSRNRGQDGMNSFQIQKQVSELPVGRAIPHYLNKVKVEINFKKY